MKTFVYTILYLSIFVSTNTFAQKANTDSLLIAKHKIINDFLSLTDKDVVADIGTAAGYSLVYLLLVQTQTLFLQ
jgi:hypothetical protein